MFDIVKDNANHTFYPVEDERIQRAEFNMGIIIPQDLKTFYKELGYGFLKTKEYNINRLMDPGSVEEFCLGTGQFKNSEEVEIYGEYTQDKLIFFEVNESLYLSIGIRKTNIGKIYYYDDVIADSLEEFFTKYLEDEAYFISVD